MCSRGLGRRRNVVPMAKHGQTLHKNLILNHAPYISEMALMEQRRSNLKSALPQFTPKHAIQCSVKKWNRRIKEIAKLIFINLRQNQIKTVSIQKHVQNICTKMPVLLSIKAYILLIPNRDLSLILIVLMPIQRVH